MSRRTQKNVGVIGLGIIGRRVADNLRRRGYHVFVWNRTPRPYPNFVGSPAEVAELCDFVQIFVSDDEALLQMVQQMKSSLHVQHVIMAHSTVAPHTMRNAAEIVKRRGAHFLDAPFTGSKVPAEKGELVYYVAGDDAAYRRARPILEATSKEIIEIGDIGQATTVKIATNMVTAASVQAAAEALALVHHSGLALEKFAAALRGNASNSGTLTMKLPNMIAGDFDPHFSVKHMLKDVQIAARMARSYGLTLGATEAARDSLLEEANSGRADQDFSSLVHSLFPEGLPSETADEEEEDAQQKLNGVEEEAVAQARREEEPAAERDPREETIRPDDRRPALAKEDADETRDDEPIADRNGDRTADDEESESPVADEPTEVAEAEESARGSGGEAEVGSREEAETPGVANSDPEPETTRSEITGAGERDDDSSPELAETEATALRDESPLPDDDVPSSATPSDVDAAHDAGAEENENEPPHPADEPGGQPTEAAADELSGEPPRERRVNGEREPAPEREDVVARRSFLSRMFGKADDDY